VRQLKGRDDPMRVIFLTGYAEEDIDASEDATVLSKPVRKDALVAAVRPPSAD